MVYLRAELISSKSSQENEDSVIHRNITHEKILCYCFYFSFFFLFFFKIPIVQMHQVDMVQALEKVHCSCLNVSETVFTATVLMQKIIIWRRKSVAWRYLLIKRPPLWCLKLLFCWMWKTDVYSAIREKKNCSPQRMLLIYVHMYFVFEPVLAALPQPLKKLAQGVQTNSPQSLLSISTLKNSISAHLNAWFKHSLRGISRKRCARNVLESFRSWTREDCGHLSRWGCGTIISSWCVHGSHGGALERV